jgi:hypothetical protein
LLHEAFVVVWPDVEPETYINVLVDSLRTFNKQILYIERPSFAYLIEIEVELVLLIV